MKRLTISDCGKFKLPPPAGTKERECPSYMDLYQRLAAYEDTGLEPEEIKAALEGAQREFEEYDEMAPKGRLRELVQADREGRCVVIHPNSVTDDDYKIICGKINAEDIHLRKMRNVHEKHK